MGNYTVPIPVDQITFPGGDLSVITNLEYRITIFGPVALAPFLDTGIDPIIRRSQLQIASQQYDSVISTAFGCPALDAGFKCVGGNLLNPVPSKDLQVLGSTNWRPRMSTGLELQMFLPVINAPFRIYWAYNSAAPGLARKSADSDYALYVPPGCGRRLYLSPGGKYLRPKLLVAGTAQDISGLP